MKKIVICASSKLKTEILSWQKRLIKLGFKVIQAPLSAGKLTTKKYATVHTRHYQKLSQADLVFVVNASTAKSKNYIGPSTFAEIAFAIGLNLTLKKRIKIHILNPIPRHLPYSKELSLWEKLGWIRHWPMAL